MPIDLSIVSVTYNDAKGLKATLESLEPLTRSSITWEHLIVDSSPEITSSVLATLPATHPIKHLKTPREGIYAAMNVGIDSANGKFIWFLNSGDCLQNFATLVKALKVLRTTVKIDFTLASTQLTEGGKKTFVQHPPKTWPGLVIGMTQVCHQSMIHRLTSLRQLGYFDTRFKVGADYEMTYRAFISRQRFKTVRGTLAAYDLGGASSNVAKAFEDFKQIHSEYSDKVPAWISSANEVFRRLYHSKVLATKAIAATPVEKLLKTVWHTWKRL